MKPDNPYQAPGKAETKQGTVRSDFQSLVTTLGFGLSIVGLSGLAIVSAARLITRLGIPEDVTGLLAAILTTLCLPGLLLSLIAHVWKSSRLTLWGVIFGLFGSFYIPTLWLPWLR